MKATCPHCQELLEANDLAVITKHVAGCKKKARKPTVQARPVQVRQVSLPTLPKTIYLKKHVLSQNFQKSKHWRHYARYAKEWYEHLEPYVMDMKGLGLSWSEWELIRVIRPPKRLFDAANLVGGAKPLPDALIRHRVIKDDSPLYFKCHYDQVWDRDVSVPDGVVTILRLIDFRP